MENKIGYIYKIISPSNRIYIGQTINLKVRKNRYRKLQCKGQIILYNSLLKYGWKNHIFEIIEEILYEKDLLNKREIYWINFYHSFGEGLNCNSGGCGVMNGRKHSEKTKEKLRQFNLGKKQSPEAKIKQIAAQKGKICSEETKSKISEANKGKKCSEETKNKISISKKGNCQQLKGKTYEDIYGKELAIIKKKQISDSKKK